MISTHILDTGKGTPASDVGVSLLKQSGNVWKELETGKTNSDGRYTFNSALEKGSYQLRFNVESYLKSNNKDYFYSEVPVTFIIHDPKRKYHIPLLLNPFGYSTYRGS